jgi:hypothetical protein
MKDSRIILIALIVVFSIGFLAAQSNSEEYAPNFDDFLVPGQPPAHDLWINPACNAHFSIQLDGELPSHAVYVVPADTGNVSIAVGPNSDSPGVRAYKLNGQSPDRRPAGHLRRVDQGQPVWSVLKLSDMVDEYGPLAHVFYIFTGDPPKPEFVCPSGIEVQLTYEWFSIDPDVDPSDTTICTYDPCFPILQGVISLSAEIP